MRDLIERLSAEADMELAEMGGVAKKPGASSASSEQLRKMMHSKDPKVRRNAQIAMKARTLNQALRKKARDYHKPGVVGAVKRFLGVGG